MESHLPSMLSPDPIEAIIVAAGRGSRLGGEVPKSMKLLGDRPLFVYSLTTFDMIPNIVGTILVIPDSYLGDAERWIHRCGLRKVRHVVPGGEERGDSVKAGLHAVSPDTEWIAIHDGARPFVSEGLIFRVLEAAQVHGAAIPGIQLSDTIKTVKGNVVERTIDRIMLRGAQTPQVFQRHRIFDAYQEADKQGVSGTDDAELVQQFTSGSIAIVDGEEDNFKITTSQDWHRAQTLLK